MKRVDLVRDFERSYLGNDFDLVFREVKNPPEKDLDYLVRWVLKKSEDYSSYCGFQFHCSSDRYRSASDIWRHVRGFLPSATLADVMASMYKQRELLGGQYCCDVERRVFKLRDGNSISLYGDDDKDEFGLYLEEWEEINSDMGETEFDCDDFREGMVEELRGNGDDENDESDYD